MKSSRVGTRHRRTLRTACALLYTFLLPQLPGPEEHKTRPSRPLRARREHSPADKLTGLRSPQIRLLQQESPTCKGADHYTCREVRYSVPISGAAPDSVIFRRQRVRRDPRRLTERSHIRPLPRLVARLCLAGAGGKRGPLAAFTLEDGALLRGPGLSGTDEDDPLTALIAYKDRALRRTLHMNSLLLSPGKEPGTVSALLVRTKFPHMQEVHNVNSLLLEGTCA